MNQTFLESLPELIETLVFGVGAAVLTIAGGYLERFAYLTVQSGDTSLGLWAVLPGLVCLAFAYLMTTDKFLPKLRELRSAFA